MEDAHIATVELGGAAGAAMFGVFDGHGGRYVASVLFCVHQQRSMLVGELAFKAKHRQNRAGLNKYVD